MNTTTPKLIIQFTRADDPSKKSGMCENIESDELLPIPAVGDIVYRPHENPAILLRVERRWLTFGDCYTHAQLFCTEVLENEA